MSTSIPIVSGLTPELMAFAAERGLTPYLEPVLQLTDRVFPGRRRAVFVDADPEIADLRYIAIGVDVTGLSADEMFQMGRTWTRDISSHCPSTHVCDFVLDWEDRG